MIAPEEILARVTKVIVQAWVSRRRMSAVGDPGRRPRPESIDFLDIVFRLKASSGSRSRGELFIEEAVRATRGP